MRPRLASAAMLGGWLCIAGLASPAFAQLLAPPQGGQGGEERSEGEVLTRGPVHEAFAEPVTFNAKPGLIVPKQPPEAIEEIPPDQKPEGENVAWISGYWTWDDERKDFVWVSGIYRVLPHGRQWVAGYWTKVPTGWQWVSGFWSAAGEVEYYPPPPESLEVGPSSEPPSANHLWIPGTWRWRETRYAWQPGYWYVAQPDWVWVPAHYLWTPHGYVFVDGYWDYVLARRGLLFAPVYFEPVIYARPRFVYRPSIVVSVNLLTDHFFCRPHYHHYYFGDYYAASYVDIGIVPWFSFHIGRRGYCPVYAHHHWHHVHHHHHADWHVHLRRDYEHRRDHVDARPPRTLVAQQTVINNIQKNVTINKTVNINKVTLAQPLAQVAQQSDAPVRLERVDRDRHEQIQQRARAERDFRRERVRLETTAADGNERRRDGRPRKIELSSPVASRAASTDEGQTTTPRSSPKAGITSAQGSGNAPTVQSGDNPRPKTGRSDGSGIPKGDGPNVVPRRKGAPNVTSPTTPTPSAKKSDDTPRPRSKIDSSPPTPRTFGPPKTETPRPKPETPRPKVDVPRPKAETPKPRSEFSPTPRSAPRRESPPPAPPRIETPPPQRNVAPPQRNLAPPQRNVAPPQPRRNDPPPARAKPSPPPEVKKEAPRSSQNSDGDRGRGRGRRDR